MFTRVLMKINDYTITDKSTTFILITEGFDERFVMDCVHQIRQASGLVSLVGLGRREVKSQHGVLVYPDLALGDVPAMNAQMVLIIPDSYEVKTKLATDPRLYHLVGNLLEAGGVVFVVPALAMILASAGIPPSPHLHLLAPPS